MAADVAASQAAAEAALEQAKKKSASSIMTHALMMSAMFKAHVDHAETLHRLAKDDCLRTAEAFIGSLQQQLADTASNGQRAEQLAEQLKVKTSCLRTAEAFIESLQQQLDDTASSNRQKAEELKVKTECLRRSDAFIPMCEQQLAELERKLVVARQDGLRLRNELRPLQQAHDFAHHVYTAAVGLVYSLCCVVRLPTCTTAVTHIACLMNVAPSIMPLIAISVGVAHFADVAQFGAVHLSGSRLCFALSSTCLHSTHATLSHSCGLHFDYC